MAASTRNFIPMQNKYSRIILLVDMDCFFCQVEEKLDPALRGKPLAVVQYNPWRGGGIIAVNYAARAKGVTRHMRGDDAREHCPEIQLVKVPNIREKADTSKYREAGKEVANVLQRFTPLLERASVDEAYLDITEVVNKRLENMNAGSFVLQPQELVNTYAVGYANIGEFVNVITTYFTNANNEHDDDDFNLAHDDADTAAARQSDIRLLLGASIASEIRAAVKAETGYDCSAGIAHNKLMAKLACGINKPNKQTLLPLTQITKLFETLPVGKITGLGGKFGEEICAYLGIKHMAELQRYSEADLQRKFDVKNGSWLYNICRGIDLEAVTPRFYSKSIGCCKKFPGRNNITGLNTLKHWLSELASEICTRLEKDVEENNRRARQMVVSFVQEFESGEEVSSSRSAPLGGYEQQGIAKQSLDLIQTNTKQFMLSGSETQLNNAIKFLGISVGKFETITNAPNKLQEMFAKQAAKCQRKSDEANNAKDKVSDDKLLTEKREDVKADVKGKGEQKMKSFFANYLQNHKNTVASKAPDGQEPSGGPDNEENLSKEALTKSFFLNALRQQSLKAESASETQPQAAFEREAESRAKSFFLNNLPNLKTEAEKAELIHSKETAVALQVAAPNKELQNEAAQSCSSKSVIVTRSAKRKFDEIAPDINNTTESAASAASASSLDYRTNYVEFAIPDLAADALLQFTRCDICDAKIPNDERSLQMHQDHHFAQQLSQQQRVEYRNENKVKVVDSVTKPAVGAAKKKPKKSPQSGKSDITKFLKTSTTTTTTAPPLSFAPSTSVQAATAQELEICDECKQPVARSEMAEHTDFHVAKELQRKLNQLEVRTVAIAKKASVGKGLHNSTLKATQRESVAKPITKFFSQQNA